MVLNTFPHPGTRYTTCGFLFGPTVVALASAGSWVSENFIPGHGGEDLSLREELAETTVSDSLGATVRVSVPNAVLPVKSRGVGCQGGVGLSIEHHWSGKRFPGPREAGATATVRFPKGR